MINPINIQLETIIDCFDLDTMIESIRCVLSCIVFQRALNIVEVEIEKCTNLDIYYPKVKQKEINDSISEYLQNITNKINIIVNKEKGFNLPLKSFLLLEIKITFMNLNNTGLFNSLFSKYKDFETWQFNIRILNKDYNKNRVEETIKSILKQIIIKSTKYCDFIQLSDQQLCFHGCYHFKITDNWDSQILPKSKISILKSIFPF